MATWTRSSLNSALMMLITGACSSDRVTEPAVPFEFASLSAGLHHTCGLSADGTAYCWGFNQQGEVGDDSDARRMRPVRVNTELRFTQVSAGTFHTCALTGEGQALCWGANNGGALGTGDVSRRLSPTTVTGNLVFTQISSGDDATCGIAIDGDTYCWGTNRSGQLGAVASAMCYGYSCSLTPLRVATPVTFSTIELGSDLACGLDAIGAAYCWGNNTTGQLGNGSRTDHAVPQSVAGGLTFEVITAGLRHVCGITAGGDAYCWGDNGSGQLGVGFDAGLPACDNVECSTVPLKVKGDAFKFSAIGAASFHSCALTTAGAPYCWGKGDAGQRGDGRVEEYVGLPVAAVGSNTFTQQSVGWFHTCAIAVDGRTWCWGQQPLGDGTEAGSAIPVRVRSP